MLATRGDMAGFLLVQGRGTSPGLACGPLCRNRPDLDLAAAAGCILVAERAVPDDIGRILAASGTITLSGAILSHVSLLSREFGRPSVTLPPASRARISSDDPRGVLALGDVVGGEFPAVLEEGDVVLLDGEAGTVRVPGGLDRETRRLVRAAHVRLGAYARLPDDDGLLRAVVDSAADPSAPVLAFILEAAVGYRLVPRGAPLRRLLDALAAAEGLALSVSERLGATASAARTRARRRCAETADGLTACNDLDELERVVRGFETALARDIALLEDAGGDPDGIDDDLDPVLRAATLRRAVLRQRIETELDEALAVPETEIADRLGGLLRVLRRCRAAGLEPGRVAPLHAKVAATLATERERAGADLVLALDPATPAERALVGGKAAGLIAVHRLVRDHGVIPRGFIVTASAYRIHLLGEVGEKLRAASHAGGDDAALSRRARAAILSGAIPDEVRAAVTEAWTALGRPRVAVRSSATIEDAPAGSLAGIFDSYLGMATLDDLLERIRWAWASLWGARALAALGAAGLSPLRAAQAVLVQELIPTRAAGVMFSRDPGGRPDTILVNAWWGLGEGISQGEIPGDAYWVRRSTGEVIATDAGAGDRMIAADPAGGGTIEVALPAERIGRPCLDARHLARLARLATFLEEGSGRAQDIEFGFDDDDALVVFQVRRVAPRRRR